MFLKQIIGNKDESNIINNKYLNDDISIISLLPICICTKMKQSKEKHFAGKNFTHTFLGNLSEVVLEDRKVTLISS
jgi:hypothetical protein